MNNPSKGTVFEWVKKLWTKLKKPLTPGECGYWFKNQWARQDGEGFLAKLTLSRKRESTQLAFRASSNVLPLCGIMCRGRAFEIRFVNKCEFDEMIKDCLWCCLFRLLLRKIHLPHTPKIYGFLMIAEGKGWRLEESNLWNLRAASPSPDQNKKSTLLSSDGEGGFLIEERIKKTDEVLLL